MRDFIDKLNKLVELADEAKIAIALAEAYNTKGLSFLGPHNEVRNALFHVIEMIKVKDEMNKYDNEFGVACFHFKRARFDAYELLCIDCIKYVEDLLVDYNHEAINIAFPAYYTEIRKTAMEIRMKLAEIKSKKNLIKQSDEDLFEFFFEQANILIEYVKKINEHIPDIIKIQKKKKKKKRKELLFNIGIAIVIAVVFFILGIYVKGN